jgi:hypothetical protein
MTRRGATGVTGTGVCATLWFTRLSGSSASRITISDADFRDSGSLVIPITVDSSASVLSPSVIIPPGGSTPCMLCDFDCDGDIDLLDFARLASFWQPANNPTGDVGPANGTRPALTPLPDTRVNFEDLFVFGMMWNWYHFSVLGVRKDQTANEEITLITEREGNEEITLTVEREGDYLYIKALGLPSFYMGRILLSSLEKLPQPVFMDNIAGLYDTDDGLCFFSLSPETHINEYITIASFYIPDYNETANISFSLCDLRNQDGTRLNTVYQKTEPARAYNTISGLNVYPNPSNPSFDIELILNESKNVIAGLYDISGRCLNTLRIDNMPQGNNAISFPDNAFSTGIYFIRITTDNESITKRVSIII